ncbi:MAG: extracellular solute-binding protein [Haloarculaceae archaeon]
MSNWTQRPAVTDRATSSRRAFLAGLASATVGTAGCVASGSPQPVSILAAGSLQRALRGEFRAAVEEPITVEARGSVAAARLVADGRRDPDVVALADPTLFSTILSAPWHATVATNALAVAYDEGSEGGRKVAEAERWYRPLAGDDVALGRTDPDLDPLGYRTVFALQLAAARHDRPDLPDQVLGPEQVYPETALLSSFETGGLDAAVVYRSMAVDRDYPRVDLPPAVDLSDPERSEAYARASYTLPNGTTVHGDAIRYGAWLRTDRPATRRVFRALAEGTGLPGHGFTIPDSYPHYHGTVPKPLRA